MSSTKKCIGYTGENPTGPHKYHKVLPADVSKWRVWSCVNCGHFMPTHLEHLLPGRLSICWRCNKEFTLTEESMQRKSEYREALEPYCPACLLTSESNEKLDSFVDNLLKNIEL